jgi:hypothetical protein
MELFGGANWDSESGDDWVQFEEVEDVPHIVPQEEAVPPPGSLISQRPKLADYVTDLSYQVETEDRQDHTFFGMMFDLEAKSEVPIEHVVLSEIAVRGDLGHVTVWWTPGSFNPVKTKKDAWTCVYDAAHPPSPARYAALQIHPVTIAPGSTIGLYIHCRHHEDTALVYDNRRSEVVFEDSFIQVHAGMAHLDNVPFGGTNPWGFGYGPESAFRANRTFVGRLQLGAKYRLWNPEKKMHFQFPHAFREMVKTFLLVARRPEASLPFDDMTLFYIFNMCCYDWFEPPSTARPLGNLSRPNINQLRRWSGSNNVYEPPRRITPEDAAGEAAAVAPRDVRDQGQRRAPYLIYDSDNEEDFPRPHIAPPGGGDSDDYLSDSELDDYDGSVEDSSDDDADDSGASEDDDPTNGEDDDAPEVPQSPERPKRAGVVAGSPAKAPRAR